jgi:hypothetical protein
MNKRAFVDNDTIEQIDKYIDDICSDPVFLCRNKNLCGTSTSIYTNVENVNNICSDLEKANECDNDFQECVVQASSLFEDTPKYISTSFMNIIIPIPNVLDSDGNQKFLRLPSLSSSKKTNSQETCSVCACMNRFATSPGAGDNSYTSPGQKQCTYLDTFEYYYYPVYIEEINSKLKDAPVITIGKYKIINSNIIYTNSEQDLKSVNLYKILTKNGISTKLAINFISNVLYKNNLTISNELQLYIVNNKG